MKAKKCDFPKFFFDKYIFLSIYFVFFPIVQLILQNLAN